MDRRVFDLEQRVSSLERQYAAILSRVAPTPRAVQCAEEDDGTVLVTMDANLPSVNGVVEFVNAFMDSPLPALTRTGPLYLNLWPGHDAHRVACDIFISEELKRHHASIECSLEEKGYSARFIKLSRVSKTSPLYQCYYRMNCGATNGRRLHAYATYVDGSAIPNSKQQHVLAVWHGVVEG